MKYRKIGLRMCIISIIMITLCIPNQIQIAKAAEGDNTADLKIYSKENGKWIEWTADTDLNIFPKKEDDKNWSIKPGDKGDYAFKIENNLGYKVDCQIKLEATINPKVVGVTPDATYPIDYQLYKRERNVDTSLLGEGWKNPFDYLDNTIIRTERIENGETADYVLRWMFEDVDSTFKGGAYNLNLTVDVKQVTDPDNPNNPDKPDNPDNPDTPDNPDNPSKPDNPNKPSDDNKGDDDNKKDNNKDNKGDNTNKGEDESKGNGSSNSNNQGNSSQESSNINNSTQNISSKGKRNIKSTDKKKVNTSDITTPVIYVALMILTLGLILLVKSRKEN